MQIGIPCSAHVWRMLSRSFVHSRQPHRCLTLVAIRLLLINYFCTIKIAFWPYPLRDFLPLRHTNFFYYYTPQRFFTPSEIFYLNPLRNFLPSFINN